MFITEAHTYYQMYRTSYYTPKQLSLAADGDISMIKAALKIKNLPLATKLSYLNTNKSVLLGLEGILIRFPNRLNKEFQSKFLRKMLRFIDSEITKAKKKSSNSKRKTRTA